MNKHWEEQGGTLSIPDGYFVTDLKPENDPPTITVSREKKASEVGKDGLVYEDITIEIPKSLAYYLCVHWAGSEDLRENIKRECLSKFKRRLTELVKEIQ